MSLLATALVGFVERRRAVPVDEMPEATAPELEGVGVPVMDATTAPAAEPTPA